MRGILISTLLVITIPRLWSQSIQEQAAAHAHAAQQAEAQNDFSAAVHEYETVVKMLPGNAEMESNLGVALYFAGDKARTLTVMQKALAGNPNLFVPHLFSGLALFQLSQPDKAARELERAVHLNDSDVTAHLWLGYAYSAQSRDEAALAEFEAASKLQPENIDAWYGAGQSYMKIGEAATGKLFAVAGDGGRAWQLAGEQYLLRGDRDKANAMFEGALERRPDIAELHEAVMQMGGKVPPAPAREISESQRSLEDGLYRQAHESEKHAEEAFSRIGELAPDSYRAHQVMGDSLSAQQRSEEAIKEYRAALALKPDLPNLHAAIANNYLRLSQPDEALREFKAELALQPNSSAACEAVGRVLTLQGNYDEAGEMLQRALHLDRPPIEAYRLMGKVDVNQRNFKDAIAVLGHYTAAMPEDSAGWYLLAAAYRADGETVKMQEAISAYKRTSTDVKERERARRAVAMFAKDNEQAETIN
ncbi:tetratricopeptide repeat protein [Silvibacterium acidisoli]|uniref:tetratricopeptide repeat protein n=1 Tax=Acidobacteriaceae bacterium ZG23-2 TaxID=2883246 RepID=UPI00406D09A0